ncbi:MAG: thioredoxin domain-containing protein, partial [Acidimicrobiia bacterium]|nr:thioredoxin domain-containing protein [Acidimicrobiia bacterium]
SRQLPTSDSLPGRKALEVAYRQIEAAFDGLNGGLGGAPKFPQQPVIEFLLRAAGQPWAPQAEQMATTTLEKMAAGGIRDQIGGGFARYSVDDRWLIPHFEKMLYDNAQLARLYLRAWQVTGIDEFREVAVDTLDYLVRDLRHPDGGFYSAEDADSEGVEGKFYVFSESEFRAVVEDGFDLVASYFGVTAEGNFEGANHLHIARPLTEVAERFSVPLDRAEEVIGAARAALFDYRAGRVRPGLDDKVITAWNGLALRAFSEAGAILQDDVYLDIARQNARFVRDHLTAADGRLLRSWNNGRAAIRGYLDDYAGYALGLFTLYQATGEVEWYMEAERLTREIMTLFADGGRLFMSGSDAEQLITRPMDQMDNPLPSGSSLAVEALLWLSLYTGEAELREAAEAVIRDGATLVERYPTAVGHLLGVLTSLEAGVREVAVVGPDADELSRVVWEEFRPGLILAVDRDGADGNDVPLLAERHHPGQTLAYVCEGFVCKRPVTDAEALRTDLL